MKRIIIISSVTVFFLSAAFANFKDIADDGAMSEFSSVKNLPVILENEALTNNRCRLHLDTGVKMDVQC